MGIAVSQLTTRLRSVNATTEPAIHWPSAVVGLFLAVVVVVGVSWLAAPRPREARTVSGPPAGTVMAGAPEAAAPVATPVPTPIPAPAIAEPQTTVQKLRVANTNGSGVNLRAKPGEKGQRLKTVPEGTTLEVIGGVEVLDGIQWRNVREPGGGVGWVAATFAAPIQ
jgi:hypothetical protein